MANTIVTPKDFCRQLQALALKASKGDEKLAAKVIIALARALNEGPMRMG